MNRLPAVLAVLVVLGYTHTVAWLKGRSDEAVLALEAYQIAADAWTITEAYSDRLTRRLGVSEPAIRKCLIEEGD